MLDEATHAANIDRLKEPSIACRSPSISLGSLKEGGCLASLGTSICLCAEKILMQKRLVFWTAWNSICCRLLILMGLPCKIGTMGNCYKRVDVALAKLPCMPCPNATMGHLKPLIPRQPVFRNGKDLNRDFPDVINQTTATRIPPPLLRRGDEQAETIAIMDWAVSRSFVASAAMHEVIASIFGHA